jgi:putative endonuclease
MGGYVSILASAPHGTLHMGVTSDLGRRIWEHRQAVGSGFCRRYEVHRLVRYEPFDDILTAIAREKRLKKMAARVEDRADRGGQSWLGRPLRTSERRWGLGALTPNPVVLRSGASPIRGTQATHQHGRRRLDRPVKPGDDGLLWAKRLSSSSGRARARSGGPKRGARTADRPVEPGDDD